MSAAEAPRLTVVEPVEEPIVLTIQGETLLVPFEDERWPIAWQLREREQALKLAEKDLRAKRALIAKLNKRNEDEAEAARKADPNRDAIPRIFAAWQKASGHARCKLTPERWDMTAARFGEDYDECVLTMAAIGVGGNPYVIEGERKDDYKTAMQSGEQVERYANRCAADIRRVLRETIGAEAQTALAV